MNSFDARSTLDGRRPRRTRSSGSTRCRRSSTSRGCRSRSRCCSRTCCATRTARPSTRDDVEALARWVRDGRAQPRDRLHARARAAAGLHRRAGRRRPGRDARRDGRPGRRPGPHQPAAAGRAGDRPLGAGGRVRHAAARSSSTPTASSSATRSATPSCAGASRRSTTSASCRPTPASSTRSTSSTWRASCSCASRRRTAAGLPRHARRHRLPHHDGERPRRAGLGSGGDRGRGGDARPAGLDADPAGDRLQAQRRAARGRDRHRPGPDRHPDAAREGRGGQVRRVLRRRASRACRWPTARRSRTWRPSRARPA